MSAQPASKNCVNAVVSMFNHALIGGEMFARSDDDIPRICDANATADEPRGQSAERLLQIYYFLFIVLTNMDKRVEVHLFYTLHCIQLKHSANTMMDCII